jgi:uncharacterized protein (DUF1501 family)
MTPSRIDRRRFLKHGLFGLSLAATAPHFLSLTTRAFAGQAPGTGRILVVLQLSGGNDGLSTVVPFADGALYRARRTAAVSEKEVLRLDATTGLHPALKGLHALYDEGRFAIVQGVSYPNPNRSHFKSMDIWHTADLRGRSVQTGWIGRAVDACCPDAKATELVVNVGSSVPYALEARIHKPVSFDAPEEYRWAGNPKDRDRFERLNDAVDGESEIAWLHRVAVDARASSEKVLAAARAYRTRVDYPRDELGRDLRAVAALIDAGLPTRVYYVSFGGFDTHNAQRNRHDDLMRRLDAALGAFLGDLRAKGHSDRVLVLSFSEFGRRVAENASGGTDHGVAGPMFLFGGRVKGGLHGKAPALDDLDDGDLRMQVDFRSVYAAVLDDWMGMDSRAVLGKRYPRLDLVA